MVSLERKSVLLSWSAGVQCTQVILTVSGQTGDPYSLLKNGRKFRKVHELNFFPCIRTQSSLGIGERLRIPLRRIFSKVNMHFQALNNNKLLRNATKALNNIIGENGLVQSRLGFGKVPRLPINISALPKQRGRMEVIAKEPMEMNAIVADYCIPADLSIIIPQHASRLFRIGDRAFVYSEKHDIWIGPFTVTYVDGKMITYGL